MAQRVETRLIDDLTGGDADETVSFGLDGETYEIELSTRNADGLRAILEPYIQGGRKQRRPLTGSARKTRRTQRQPQTVDFQSAEQLPLTHTQTPPSTATVRAWAASNGYAVNPRGRLPQHVVEAFAAANP